MWEITERLKEQYWKGRKKQIKNLRTNAIAKRICQERKCHARQSNRYIKYSGLVLRVQIQDQIPQEDKLTFTMENKI